MRVLLIHPADFPDPDRPAPLLPPNQAPPLGLAYIAGYLREAGHDVAIIDMKHGDHTPEQLMAEVRAFDPALVGLGLYTVTVPVAEQISQLIKAWKPTAQIVVGGPHPAGAPAECARNPHFDFAAIGEGEVMMVDLAACLESGGDLATVAGLWFVDPDGEVITNAPRGWIDDLDKLPYPARDLLPPLDSYEMTMFQYRRWPATTIYTSRGCPYSCIFCERREILGNKFRVHSPAYVADEIEHLQATYGIQEIFFYDDTFTLDRRRVVGICEEILDRGIDISWNISTHVETVDREVLRIMRKAGCWQIAYGIETGDPRVMQDIMKGTDVSTVRERIAWTTELGIEAKGLFMIGHPTDTPESIDRTVEFARSLPIASANFKITTPFVGTPLRDMAADYGALDEDDYRNYMGDPQHAVFVANGLTRDYLMGVQRRAYWRFYSRPGRLIRLAQAMTGRNNWGKFATGARLMGRLALHQARGPEGAPGVVPTFLEFEH
ncbi:MAG: radical SAM protein [Proteobacteria bacterium]|nr:radical SAM protein [Pseudomonadota bacterium]